MIFTIIVSICLFAYKSNGPNELPWGAPEADDYAVQPSAPSIVVLESTSRSIPKTGKIYFFKISNIYKQGRGHPSVAKQILLANTKI